MSAASSSDKFVEIYKQTLDDVAIWKPWNNLVNDILLDK